MEALAVRFVLARVVALGMIGVLLVFALVGELLAPGDPGPATPRAALLLAGTVMAAAIPFVRRRLRLAGAVSPPEAEQRLLVVSITTSALCEAVGAIGLALFAVTGQKLEFHLLLALAILLQVLYFPRRERWEARVAGGAP